MHEPSPTSAPAPGPQAGAPQPSSARSRLARWRGPLQIAFAVLVLAWVLNLVPWSDSASWRPPDDPQAPDAAAARVELAGELQGDWKQDHVAFLPAEDPAAWPAVFAQLPRGADGRLELARGTDGGFDWRPGMVRVFREVDPRGLALALALFTVGQLIVVTRWWRLLLGAGLAVRWYESLRLTSLGLFFNLAVPGLTGGDLVKALLAARAHPEQKAAALVSIAFDRLLGLLCMVVLAAVAVLLSGSTFAAIRWPVVATAAAGIAGATAVLSGGLRRALGIERLLARLPLGKLLRELDDAVTTYARKLRILALCALLSFLNHLTVIAGILVLGRAFGDTVLASSSYFAIAPVATVVSALPLAPGGWGLGEAVYSRLFDMLGASAAVGLATSISFRLLQMAISLAAGLFLFAPGSARLSEMKHMSESRA